MINNDHNDRRALQLGTISRCRRCDGAGWRTDTLPCLECGGRLDSWAADEDGEVYQDGYRQGGTGHRCKCGGVASNDGPTAESWLCLDNDCDVAACPDRPCPDCGGARKDGVCRVCEAENGRVAATRGFRAMWGAGA